jgi:glucose/arabinose dehydrogenase
MTRTLSIALVLLASCLSGGAEAAPEALDGNHAVTLVTEDLSTPTAMAFIGPDDFLVLEKNNGRVQRFASGARTQVLDLHVTFDSERGLLGIAVHPDFAAAVDPKPWVYLYYTASPAMADVTGGDQDNKIERFTWNGNNLVSDGLTYVLPAHAGTHNGGALAFGPDEKLYGVVGDNQLDGQLQNNGGAPAATEITGSIVRLNDDLTVPTDNPLDADANGTDLLDALYAYGVRNSFGLAFDPQTGDLWDSENGPTSFDEVNHVAPGFNSGWRDEMGPAAMLPPPGLVELTGSAYADPAYSIETPVAVTGLAFVGDDSSLGTEYVGNLLVADFELGNVYRFELNPARDAFDLADDVADTQSELNQHRFAFGFEGGISDLKEGPDGAIYVVNIGSSSIYKIEGGGGPVVHDLAVASVKAPSRVSLSESRPEVTSSLAVTIVNTGTATETVVDIADLGALVTLNGTALTDECPDAPAATLLPPKKGFPVVLGPRKKLKVGYTATFECASDTPLEVEYQWDVAVDLETALGNEDAVPANDVCPRAASADDKGCGGKPAGSPIQTDVQMK